MKLYPTAYCNAVSSAFCTKTPSKIEDAPCTKKCTKDWGLAASSAVGVAGGKSSSSCADYAQIAHVAWWSVVYVIW